MANEEQEKDRLIEIQDRMNSMDVTKRKRILYIFAIVCVAVIALRIVVTFIGYSRNKEQEEERKAEQIRSEQQQVLEYSLERKEKDKKIEEFMDQLVEEDRKSRNINDGETK